MLDDLRRLTLLTAGLKQTAEAEKLLEHGFRKPSPQRRSLYRRIGLKTMLMLARKESCTVYECVQTLKLILATHAQLDEQELLNRLVTVLCHLLHAQWNEVMQKMAEPQRLRLFQTTESEYQGDPYPIQDQEMRYAWTLSRQLLRECA